METKRCSKCKKEFPKTTEYFYTYGKYLRHICKACSTLENREWREKNSDHKKAYDKEYSKRNKDKIKERYHKHATLARIKEVERLYNLTEEELQDKMNLQNGCCAICKDSLVGPNSTHSYSIDHNHSTGDARGLLCPNCNTAIGLLREDLIIFESAIEYLRVYNAT